MNIVWFSSGVSSAISAILCRDELDLIIRIVMPDEHLDNNRFSDEIEEYLKPIPILKLYPQYNVETVLKMFPSFGRHSKCTEILKKRLRKTWERENKGRHCYYWGYDRDEKGRMDNLISENPKHDHRFPLIEKDLSKEDSHAILERIGIKRPAMYDLGFHNSNCIGCPKGGKWYWNKIRKFFPLRFEQMKVVEREIGYSFINECYLDELDPNSGREEDEISQECGIACFIEFSRIA